MQSFTPHQNQPRSAKHCRDHYACITASRKAAPWSQAEEQVLVEGHRIYGPQWTKLAEYIPGRSQVSSMHA